MQADKTSVECLVRLPSKKIFRGSIPANTTVKSIRSKFAADFGNNTILVLLSAAPPREVKDTDTIAACGKMAGKKSGGLEFELRPPVVGPSWSQIAVGAPKKEETRGVLKIDPNALKGSSSSVQGVPTTSNDAAGKQRGGSGGGGHHRPKPTQNVYLSDLIDSQLAAVRLDGKPVKISLAAAQKAQHIDPSTLTKGKVRSNPNPADSRADVRERGKERLAPKKKKPTKLKMIIESERKGKQAVVTTLTEAKVEKVPEEEEPVALEEEEEEGHLDEDREEAEAVIGADDEYAGGPIEGEFRLIQKPFSPIDLTQRSETELEMNRKIVAFLQEVNRFQKNAFQKNPEKARLKKRLIYGLREVERAARRKELKCAFLAPNVEDIAAVGGLNELQMLILEHCKAHNVPLLICLSRKQLGKAMGKRIAISALGIISYDGANAMWKEILPLYDIVAAEREKRTEVANQTQVVANSAAAVAHAPIKSILKVDAPEFVLK